MKTLLLLVSLLSFPCFAQTNWPAYRVVSNQVYNVALSTKWTTLVPRNAMVDGFRKGDHPKGQLVRVNWQERARNPMIGFSVLHVPFDPILFREGKFGIISVPTMPIRALLVSAHTNYTVAGIVQSIDNIYDYGLPVKAK